MSTDPELANQLETEAQKELIRKLAKADAERLRRNNEEGSPLGLYDLRKDPNRNERIDIGDIDDERLLELRYEYLEDRKKLGDTFPDNLDQVVVTQSSRPGWQMTPEDFVKFYAGQYQNWKNIADAKLETLPIEQRGQFREHFERFRTIFLQQVRSQNDLGDSEFQESGLEQIYTRVVENFVKKEKSKIDDNFVNPILQNFDHIDLKNGRNTGKMGEEFIALMPPGVEIEERGAAFYVRDPNTNLVYVIPLTNNTIQKEWRDLFIASKGEATPIKKVLTAAVVIEQKSESGNNSWAILKQGKLEQ